MKSVPDSVSSSQCPFRLNLKAEGSVYKGRAKHSGTHQTRHSRFLDIYCRIRATLHYSATLFFHHKMKPILVSITMYCLVQTSNDFTLINVQYLL